jgi:hypothetical protein
MPGSGDGIGMACVWVDRIACLDYSKRRSMHLLLRQPLPDRDQFVRIKCPNKLTRYGIEELFH